MVFLVRIIHINEKASDFLDILCFETKHRPSNITVTKMEITIETRLSMQRMEYSTRKCVSLIFVLSLVIKEDKYIKRCCMSCQEGSFITSYQELRNIFLLVLNSFVYIISFNKKGDTSLHNILNFRERPLSNFVQIFVLSNNVPRLKQFTCLVMNIRQLIIYFQNDARFLKLAQAIVSHTILLCIGRETIQLKISLTC